MRRNRSVPFLLGLFALFAAYSNWNSNRNSTMSRLTKRIAVVTGGNKGIGFEIARKLAEQKGVKTILTARSTERGAAACDALKKDGLEVQFHLLNIDDKKSIATFSEWIRKEYGGLDILVNNAAVAFKSSDPTPFKGQAAPTLKTNYWGTLDVCEALIPIMREGGNVVNVASRAGTSALKGMSEERRVEFLDPKMTKEGLGKLCNTFVEDVKDGKHQEAGWANSCYGTSKAAVIVLTRILAKELASKKIVCNSMCPGYCKTDMTSNMGYRSAAEGADTAVWLALQVAESSDDKRPTGGFFADRKPLTVKP
ncbi:hypothetical protein AAMO2058_000840500 [Amorphochlora amoebiformis]